MDNKQVCFSRTRNKQVCFSRTRNKFRAILIVIIAALVLIGAGFWYWQKKSSTPASSGSISRPVSQTQTDQKTADISLGSQILQKTQNPAKDKLPETNPFQTETNPLKAQYVNPFK